MKISTLASRTLLMAALLGGPMLMLTTTTPAMATAGAAARSGTGQLNIRGAVRRASNGSIQPARNALVTVTDQTTNAKYYGRTDGRGDATVTGLPLKNTPSGYTRFTVELAFGSDYVAKNFSLANNDRTQILSSLRLR